MGDTETTNEMTLDAMIARLRTIADEFIAAAEAARTAFIDQLSALDADPGFKALEARQKPIVDAILKAEWARIAKAIDQ